MIAPKTISGEERIRCLRERCLTRKNGDWKNPFYSETLMLTAYYSLKESEGLPWQIRCGLRTRDRLAAVSFELDELELLAGRIAPVSSPCPENERKEAEEYLRDYPRAPGQTGHCELDFSEIFKLGIGGMIANLQEKLKCADGEKSAVYQSFIYALQGLKTMIENAARAGEVLVPEAAPERAEELKEIIASCRRIADAPPAGFRDAIQLIWFTDMSVMLGESVGLVVPGRLDRTLLPFYESDIAHGKLKKDEALLLIEQLYLLINETIPDGLAMSVMVGGRDCAGKDVTNELSYLCMEALRRTRLVYPTVGVCWHEGTPEALTDLAAELIAAGYATPAFFGDETIQTGLKSYGIPPEESCNYINSTCVEITPCGSSNVWVASPYFSTCKILMEEIKAQVETGKTASGYDKFFANYCERLGGEIKTAAEGIKSNRRKRSELGGKPLQSVFTLDCISRGKDIDRGGARYNWVECSFVGLANLADSLHVIRKAVYEDKELSLAELLKLCKNDFSEDEPMRRHFANTYAKYGNAEPEVDKILDTIVDFLKKECAKYKLPPDTSHFIPGAFCWIKHEALGRECGATPDGRRAGTPFADGAGPAQGREKNGPTAAILSTTSWNHSPMIGGTALNMKFSSRIFDSAAAVTRLRDLIVTFLKRGGFEVQVNVVDRELLQKAKEDPDSYRDLVVRIGGYTDYFTRLAPGMQDEVIMRAEFNQL